jgi:hypothetical protein
MTIGDLHQPDPHEDRRGVRQPGNHHRRQCPQILRLGAAGHPPHPAPSRNGQEVMGNRTRVGWSRTRWRRPSRCRVRHPLRRGHLPSEPAICSISAWNRASSKKAAPGTPTTASASARAGTTSKQFLTRQPGYLRCALKRVRNQAVGIEKAESGRRKEEKPGKKRKR